MDTGNLDLLPEEVLKEILLLEEHQQRLDTRDEAQKTFMTYVNHVYDGFIVGLSLRPFSCLRGSWAEIQS